MTVLTPAIAAVRFFASDVRKLAALIAVLGLATAIGSGMSSAEARDRTVRTQGDESFVANAKVMATLRFSPGHIVVNSGDTLTFTHSDNTEDPHTLSIVNAADLPANTGDVFNCGAPGTVCDEVFSLFPPGPPPPSGAVEAPGSQPGLDARLDTLFVTPGESISAVVSAPSGSTLHFMCAIHAWMQGTIDVH